MSGDAFSTADDSTARVTSARPIYMFLTSNIGPQKILLVEKKKNDWLKNRPFFITENFLGILDRLCAEPMRRSRDFFRLTLAVVGSTSGSCYFLLPCQCRSVYVLCVLVVRSVKVKRMNQKRFDVFYYNRGSIYLRSRKFKKNYFSKRNNIFIDIC